MTEQKTEAEKTEAAAEIERTEATQQRPRGGVHDREDDDRQTRTPPPLDH